MNSVTHSNNEFIRYGIPKNNYSNESTKNMAIKDSNKNMANTYSSISINNNKLTSANPKKHKSQSNLTRPISA